MAQLELLTNDYSLVIHEGDCFETERHDAAPFFRNSKLRINGLFACKRVPKCSSCGCSTRVKYTYYYPRTQTDGRDTFVRCLYELEDALENGVIIRVCI